MIVFEILEIFVAFLGAVGVLALGLGVLTLAKAKKAKGKSSGADNIALEMFHLNENWKERTDGLRDSVLSKAELKKIEKKEKESDKLKEKSEKKAAKSDSEPDEPVSRTYVLQFEGDIHASQVDGFRVAISALLPLLNPKTDEVILKLESPGGVVHGYGLAAAQVMRLKSSVKQLTICVDKVAASGGYMMACLGHKIVASPFAIVGSIGVVAGVPNFHRLMDDKKIDYLEMTAGKFKRTLTTMGEITDEKKEKFQSQLEEIHEMFKGHVQTERPSLDLEMVGTGEYWHGIKAIDLKLVDELSTSDEVIAKAMAKHDVYQLSYKEKESVKDKLAGRLLASAIAKFGGFMKWNNSKGDVASDEPMLL